MVRIKFTLFVALMMSLCVFSSAEAQDEPAYNTRGLLIYNVWVRPTAGELPEGATPEPPIPGTTTGAYMTIQNASETDYQLVAISTDAAEMTHVHETTMEGDVGRMRMIGAVDIPAGETVMLAPLGFHAMLMNATRDIHPGEAVALTLTFADADGETFDVPVAAYATDFPPPEDALMIANASADLGDEGTLNVLLLVANRGAVAETLTTVTTVPVSTAVLLWREQRSPFPISAVELPPQAETPFAPPAVFVSIRLSEFVAAPQSAFTLTLEFASGKTLTLAVPVIGVAP